MRTVIAWFFLFFGFMPPASAQSSGAGALRTIEPPRESITFLLGEDEGPSLPLFIVAERFFREDSREHTDQLVGTLRSLKAVRDHLASHPPKRGGAWGLINLVVHGNEHGLMDVAITPGGPKATRENLEACLRNGELQPLSHARVDALSEIRVHGCSVGKDRRMLRLLAQAFGGANSALPQVRATQWFTCFQSISACSDGSSQPGTARFLCESWDLYFRPGERPSNSVLASQFRSMHPKIHLDPVEALTHSFPTVEGEAFSYEAPVTFQWTLVYPCGEQPPNLIGAVQKCVWLLSQETFQRRLRAAGLRFHQLSWQVAQVTHSLAGSDRPALQVLGKGRVIHLLRALKPAKEDRSSDPRIAWDDARYFVSAR